MIAFALKLHQAPAERTAKRLFAFSILYLFVLFSVLLAEQGIGASGWGLPFGRIFA
jgi:heme O synthase-like polyprenyltransferase